MQTCACCSKKSYDQCCGPFIMGTYFPETPEELMRSRYTAYTQANIDYIIRTMRGSAAKDYDPVSAKHWAKIAKWRKLEVLRTYLENQEKGFVEFKAYYSYQGKPQLIHELSEFHKDNGQWFYVAGTILNLNQ